MSLLGIPILTFIAFFPLAGLPVLLALPGARKSAIKATAIAVAAVELRLSDDELQRLTEHYVPHTPEGF